MLLQGPKHRFKLYVQIQNTSTQNSGPNYRQTMCYRRRIKEGVRSTLIMGPTLRPEGGGDGGLAQPPGYKVRPRPNLG